MVSRENVMLVRPGLAGVDAFWALFDDDIVFDTHNYKAGHCKGYAEHEHGASPPGLSLRWSAHVHPPTPEGWSVGHALS
jgi:hypothetical protein